MNRKMDWGTLFLFMALLFGAAVRFQPVIANGFPLNDGGMFYTMINDLKTNHYLLPEYTTYNSANIPFAYPPLGFYVAAFLSGILPVSNLQILLWIPALVNAFSVLVFYKLAGQILDSRITATLATLVYALLPRSFLWQVMGGGITRTFGMLFLLLMLWQAVQLFKDYSHKKMALTILFGAGAVLSHPQTALHAALGGALLFAFYGRNKRGMISALVVGLGVALLTSPWWGTILSLHGFAPLLSAGQTSRRTLAMYLVVLKLYAPGNFLALPVLLLIYTGVWISAKSRDFFLPVWIALAYLIDPRGGGGAAALADSMLAGMGLLKLAAWIGGAQIKQDETVFANRSSRFLVFGAVFCFIIAAGISDFQLVNTSLKPDDLKMIAWVNSNVDQNKNFLLATGREFSMSDPLQEWFPALTKQHSVTTLQGLEWTLGEKFFPWYAQLADFQHCADVACVSEWSARNGADYDYLITLIPPETDKSAMADSLRSLAVSARASSLYVPVYESEHALVFELRMR
jgi:hypothetical protein